jgi:hypothetical protein
MQYTYSLILHNAAEITIKRACDLADKIQVHIDREGTHVQGVTVKKKSVSIIIETPTQLNDLFNLIYDNRIAFGYKDFSIYYSEGFERVVERGYGQ